jgi:ABC-type lipoprotein export system ATPase subunit
VVARTWLILADEPAGRVDVSTSPNIIASLSQVAVGLKTTLVVASHDAKVEEADLCWG